MLAARTVKRIAFVVVGAALALAIASRRGGPPEDGTPSGGGGTALNIGHVRSPLLGPLYSAATSAQSIRLTPFASSGDVGMALLGGELDAGLVEPEKAINLLQLRQRLPLLVAGVIEFPYGATLVIRKDLDFRLDDLPGKRVATIGARCRLMHQFRADAHRLDVPVDKIRFVTMPFDAMLPALESGVVDGALMKGSAAVLAELQGHKVLYQNWDVKAVDECCPAVLAQAEYFLLVRPDRDSAVRQLVSAMTASNRLAAADCRKSITSATGFPAEPLERYPLSRFSPVDEELRKKLGASVWRPGS